jgi:invasion protein IalB
MVKTTALIKGFLIATFAVVLPASAPVEAQKDSRRHLGSYRSWDAFVYGTGTKRTCHIISVPKSSTASKKKARRGDIYIMVSHRPEYGIVGEVNAVLGYPIRQGSTAKFNVDGGRKRIEFFTEGTGAWAYDPKDDAAAIKAMKRGSGLVISATSQRGTKTTDRYSLSGFTAAYNAITKACR